MKITWTEGVGMNRRVGMVNRRCLYCTVSRKRKTMQPGARRPMFPNGSLETVLNISWLTPTSVVYLGADFHYVTSIAAANAQLRTL